MKITIGRDELADALAFVARISPKRPTAPVLSGVLLRAAEGELTLTVFDYQVAAETEAEADVAQAGTVLVHAGMFSQIAGKLPAGYVTLESDERVLKIRCGSVRTSMPLMPAGEYPQPQFDSAPIATFSGAVFEDAVARTVFAVSNDEVKPVLQGVNLLLGDGGAVFTATNRYRIAMLAVDCGTEGALQVTLPALLLREAAKVLGSSDEVTIGLTERGTVTIAGDFGVLLATPLSEEYPPVARFFPREPRSKAVVDRDLMAAATQRGALGLYPQGVVEYVFTEGTCSTSSSTDERGISEDFVAGYEGGELAVKFKPQFVLEGLQACGSEQVEIWFTHEPGASRPGQVMLRGADGYRYLMQPNIAGVEG